MESHTRTDSFRSEPSDEEVVYGYFAIETHPPTDSDHAFSTPEHDTQD